MSQSGQQRARGAAVRRPARVRRAGEAQPLARDLGLPDGRRGDRDHLRQRNRVALDSLAFRPRVLRNVEKVDTGGKLLGQAMRFRSSWRRSARCRTSWPQAGWRRPQAAAQLRRDAHAELGLLSGPGGRRRRQRPPQDLPALRARRSGLGGRLCGSAPSPTATSRCASPSTSTTTAAASATSPSATRRRRGAAGAGRSFPGALLLGRRRAAQEEVQDPVHPEGHRHGRGRQDRASSTASRRVYVSNHGGRQLDHGKGGMAVLPEVVEAVAGARRDHRRRRLPARRRHRQGHGARRQRRGHRPAAGPGARRPAACRRLVRALELLEDEMRRCLGLLGVTSCAELDGSYVAPVAPLPREGWDSAFPLLKEGY